MSPHVLWSNRSPPFTLQELPPGFLWSRKPALGLMLPPLRALRCRVSKKRQRPTALAIAQYSTQSTQWENDLFPSTLTGAPPIHKTEAVPFFLGGEDEPLMCEKVAAGGCPWPQALQSLKLPFPLTRPYLLPGRHICTQRVPQEKFAHVSPRIF